MSAFSPSESIFKVGSIVLFKNTIHSVVQHDNSSFIIKRGTFATIVKIESDLAIWTFLVDKTIVEYIPLNGDFQIVDM